MLCFHFFPPKVAPNKVGVELLMIRHTRQALLVLSFPVRFHSGRVVVMHRWSARNHPTSRTAWSVTYMHWMYFATPSGKQFDLRNTFGVVHLPSLSR